jgi:hypothetical protein
LWIIVAIVMIWLLIKFFAWLNKTTAPIWAFFGHVFTFIFSNYYLLGGLGLLVMAIFVYTYFKPHPAEKHFIAYKKGDLSRPQAIEKIASTMYHPWRDHLPSTYQSRIMTKRVEALRKRVTAEADFMEELIRYIKAKSMIE